MTFLLKALRTYAFAFVFAITLLATSRTSTAAEESPKDAKRPPNIVIIFIDDMGYADIGPFGASAYKTPHLDQMAKEGRVFTDFHSATAVCSASRVGLMTGCYPERVSILGALSPSDAATLRVVPEPNGNLRFDIHLQGEHETVFFDM